MRIDLYCTAAGIPESGLRGRTTIALDVLRLSTCIASAVHLACKDIIPTRGVEAALALSQNLGRSSVLLCGEQNGKKIEGFDLGSSPSEYTAEIVQGRVLVFAVTNGSSALARNKPGEVSLVACFLNASSVSTHAALSSADVVIICSGVEGALSLEDAVCGGLIVSRLCDQFPNQHLQLNDAAVAARALYEHYAANILGMLRISAHGRHLAQMGLQHDLEICAQVDALDVVPVLLEGHIRPCGCGRAWKQSETPVARCSPRRTPSAPLRSSPGSQVGQKPPLLFSCTQAGQLGRAKQPRARVPAPTDHSTTI